MGFLKNLIFNLFDSRDDFEDNYIVNGKGFEQRFQETLAEDLDENEIDSIRDLNESVIIPQTMNEEFLIDEQFEKGVDIGLSNDPAVKRRILKMHRYLVNIKGTKRSYGVLLRLVGVDLFDIIEHPNISGFDSGKFDNPERRFDGKCKSCSKYTLKIYATETPELVRAINKIIDFCEPIDAILKEVLFVSDELQTGGLDDTQVSSPLVHSGGFDEVSISASLQNPN